jgi:transcriptional regulator with XRE-family HTH domain
MPPFDWRRLRGMLAERRITYTNLGAAAGLNPVFVSRILRGVSVPGELARIRLARGLRALNLADAIGAVGLPFPDDLPRMAVSGVARASMKEAQHAAS